ncbi:disintegrin and metalloproteinase domain-containing protein 21-like [Suncus etruscus]|uniref:disintegrin and metalloproteinase domain-containing protein 21-like n=1 Tax=Suncus etruscus TaxID=109475 RepID=UPI0021104BE1|nr:disintegrin and metalloproteinase domain-containing protein 21-like [Suncus etruscus]
MCCDFWQPKQPLTTKVPSVTSVPGERTHPGSPLFSVSHTPSSWEKVVVNGSDGAGVPAPWQVSLKLDMMLAEGRGCPRFAVLLLGLWVLLAQVLCSQGRPSWRYVSSEVVVPQKELYQGYSTPLPGWLSYSLHFGGLRRVIRMRRKMLLVPGPLLLLTQDVRGTLQTDYPFIPTDCYYLGYVEETPLSTVTLDTCYGGLHGIMKLDDLTFEIKPLKGSQRFEHVVSRLEADPQAMRPVVPLEEEEEEEEGLEFLFPQLPSKLYTAHQGHIQGLFMSSFSTYTLFGNVTECIRFLVRMSSLIDTFVRGVDLRVYVSILLIFNMKEPVKMDDYRVPGSPFHTYYRYFIYLELTPDAGIIVIRGRPPQKDFLARSHSICKEDSLIMLSHGDRHFFLLAIAATSHLGRVLGLNYDTPECVCQRRSTCLMSRFPELADTFSNCSLAQMGSLFHHTHGRCLFRGLSTFPSTTLTRDRCGNRAVGRWEDCDCGSFKECSQDACCTSECRFSPGTKCAVGACCQSCGFAPAGTLCRPIADVCDLPEYCLGTNYTCPDNTYIQDGTPCSEDSYCFRGNCTDRTMQCQEIFGPEARNGDGCYMINTFGSRFGHCGRNEARVPQKCDWADVTCGRLQCTNVTQIPQLPEHVGFHQSLVQASLCFGLDEHRATPVADMGQVQDGAPCLPGKFCLDGKCKGEMWKITYDCTPEKCSYRGICNNYKSCHCRPGWNPPRCINPGPGGSVESGHPRFRLRSQFITQNRATLELLRIMASRLYMFICSLLLGVAANTKTILKDSKTEEKEEKKAKV